MDRTSVPHAIGDHALLADGRTATLLAPDGEVAWLCWPRVDSTPCLLSILDGRRGGTFALRPRTAQARVADRRYPDEGLCLRTTWTLGRALLNVDEALAMDEPPGLLRLLEAEGAPVAVEVRFAPAFDAARSPAVLSLSGDGRRVLAAGAGLCLAVDGPASWELCDGTAVSHFEVVPGRAVGLVLSDAKAQSPAVDIRRRLTATQAYWRGLVNTLDLRLDEHSPAVRALGEEEAQRLLARSAAVLSGLCQRGGGLVAAPTTSLPQWPGSPRTWDYRYAWLRDTALGARALLRLGRIDTAHRLAAFCGEVCGAGAPPALLRVDGSAPPAEETLDHLQGYGGARPVRLGNAAAGQRQLDVAGALLDLALALGSAGALPPSLRHAVPALAEWAAASWRKPDHGIWEVRGPARRYTHSRVAAWGGLRAAAALARAGVVTGDATAWEHSAAEVRAWVLRSCIDAGGALTLHEGGGGPDAALAEAVSGDFLDAGDRCAAATLAAITAQLLRGGLTDRYLGRPDHLPGECAPFVFPTFWLAEALQACGEDPVPAFAAAAASRGPLDLFGEVADPVAGGPLGNYPQAQSHAALVIAAMGRP